MFNKDTYIQRRQQLMCQVGSGLILLLGNHESPMNYADNTYRFRQDSTFLYYFGLSRPGLCALLDATSGQVTIFGDEYTIDDMVWMGDIPTIRVQAKEVGVDHTASFSSLQEQISKHKRDSLHILPPYRAQHQVQLSEMLEVSVGALQGFVSESLCFAVAKQRNYKTEEELVEINKAVDISTRMHKLGMRMVKPQVKEKEIFAALEHMALAQGGDTSFPTIATINGQTLHNHHYDNVLQDADLCLIDSGCMVSSGYTGDLSSTVPVSGKFTSRQADIYQLSLDSHRRAIAMLSPGVSFKSIYYESARVIVDGMKSLGLMKGDTEAALESGAHAMFYPCGLGHMMGLDVHDMENIGESIVGYNGAAKSTQFGPKSLRLGRNLEPGFVLTIEPGIYFIPALMDKWQAENINQEFFNYDKLQSYRDFGGIRNEEDFVITDEGCTRLGSLVKPTEMQDVIEEWHKPAEELLNVCANV